MRFIVLLALCLVVSSVLGQVKFAHGLKFEEGEYERVPVKAHLTRGDYDDIPSNASLKEYCPKPGNQLQLQTSSNWAISYGALTILEAKANGLTDTREITKNAYSPVFDYSLGTKMENDGCLQSTTLTSALEALKNFGSPKYVEFQEFCPKVIPQNIYEIAIENRITDYVRLFDTDDEPESKIENVKKALAEDMPVVIGMICPPSFQIAQDFWQPREKVSDEYPGQALCVVGYDDTKYGGAFELLNSWGKNWGNEGYIWVRYTDFVEFTKSAYELFIIDQENRNAVDFSGEIKLVLGDGNFMNTILTNDKGYYKTSKSYGEGTSFRIYISNNETAYVYVFGTDLTNEYFTLFPMDENTHPILNYKQSSVALPSEKHHITITGDPGKNFLIILYSKEEIALKSLTKKMMQLPGRVDDRLENIMGDYLIAPENIQWANDQIKFSGQGNGKTLVAVFVEMDHN